MNSDPGPVSADQIRGLQDERLPGLAVIGCGRVFQRFHWPALSRVPAMRLVGACDTSEASRAWLARRQPDALITNDCDELLRHPDVDAVLVATPPDLHARIAMAALATERHVLVEKPLGVNADEAMAVADRARAARRVAAVGFTRRFRRSYRRLRAEVLRLAPEEIRSIRFTLAFPVQQWGAITGYLGNAAGGGVLEDVASHQLDLVPWLLDSRIQAVRVLDWQTTPQGGELLHYRIELENGCRATCEARHDARYREELRIVCRHRTLLAHPYGYLTGPVLPESAMRVAMPWLGRGHLAASRILRRPNRTVESFARQLSAFANAVANGGSPDELASASDAASCHAAMEACRRSLAGGTTHETVAA